MKLGMLGLILVMGVVGVIVSVVTGVSIITGLLTVGLVVAVPFVGLFVVMLVPVPVVLKFIAGMTASLLTMIYGLRYLGVL